MCSMYWNLHVEDLECPACLKHFADTLQTHFMGEVGSCLNFYVLGQPVDELRGLSLVSRLSDRDESLSGHCPYCNTWIDFDAIIREGTVVEVMPFVKTIVQE